VNLLSDSITGTVLSATSPVFMPDGFSAGRTNFFFPNPVPVNPGTTYYFQPVTLPGSDNLWGIIENPNYNYAGGTAFVSGAPTSPASQLWFREGILVPEPSSMLLFCAGTAVVAVCRWLRARTPIKASKRTCKDEPRAPSQAEGESPLWRSIHLVRFFPHNSDGCPLSRRAPPG
jgi:hypothetical protein